MFELFYVKDYQLMIACSMLLYFIVLISPAKHKYQASDVNKILV